MAHRAPFRRARAQCAVSRAHAGFAHEARAFARGSTRVPGRARHRLRVARSTAGSRASGSRQEARALARQARACRSTRRSGPGAQRPLAPLPHPHVAGRRAPPGQSVAIRPPTTLGSSGTADALPAGMQLAKAYGDAFSIDAPATWPLATWLVLVGLAVALAVAVPLLVRRWRRDALIRRFGDEYERTVEE